MVNEKDISFARDLVALARKNGIGKLSVEFDTSFDRRFKNKEYHSWGSKTFRWKEPGHSSKDELQIVFESRLNVDVSET